MFTSDVIESLSQNTSETVLSLYLHVDPGYQPNQNETPAWQIYVKNTLRDLREQDVTGADTIAKHTHDFLDGFSPVGKSLALFMSDQGVIDHINLPIAIDNNHYFGEINLVPLLWAQDEYERYLVVLVDSEEARFLSAYLGRATDNNDMHLDFDDYDFRNKQFIHANHSTGSEGQQGSGGDQFADMKSEHIRRFHNDVAEQTRNIMDDMQAERIILGGNEQAAHQVKGLLHSTLQKKVIDILSIPMQASEASVADAIRDTALNYERSYELDLVNDVISLAKAGGRGAMGIDDIREALEMQQIELLILPYPMEDAEIAHELSVLALKAGADIELVHGSAATRLQQEAPVIARRYYAIPEA